MTTETDSVAIQHEYLTDATFVPRMARTYLGFIFTRPSVVIVLGCLIVFGLGSLAVGRGSWEVNVAGILLGPIIALVAYWRTKRGNERRLPVGSRIAVGLGPTTMRIESPLSSSDTSYRAFSRAYRRGDFVILSLQGVRAYSVFPLELFPGADFENLRDAIVRANATPGGGS